MRALLASGVLLVGTVLAAGDASLQQSYETHRWFDLRDAIRGKHASLLYSGAVASAFGDTKSAEKDLDRAVAEASRSDEANQAREQLAYLYARLGKSRDAVREFDEILKSDPNRQDVAGVRTLFSAFSRYPDLSIGRTRHSVLKWTARDSVMTLPASVNGTSVRWMFDTGFNLSGISEAEAQMLGLKVEEVGARTNDMAGGAAAARATGIPRLTLGTLELDNVPMLVLPDSQPPMNDLPPGERGILGLPVAIAFQAFRWSANGDFEIGPPANPSAEAGNLCFDGLFLVTRTQFQGKPLDFVLDTGNGAGTQLWSRFSNDFPALLKEQGSHDAKRVTQVGGSNTRDVTVLPEVRIRIGGMETVLRPANVFDKPVGNEFQHGLIGMDLLTQAREVKVDFRSMSVVLDP